MRSNRVAAGGDRRAAVLWRPSRCFGPDFKDVGSFGALTEFLLGIGGVRNAGASRRREVNLEVIQVTSRSREYLKLLSAVVGASAAVTLAVLSMALSPERSGPASVAGSDMNIGQTSTETTPSLGPGVSMAVPAIKGPAALPSEQQGAM